jgi:glycosidase
VELEYNILNHTEIDPVYGDFNDFYELIHKAHDKSNIC